MFFAQFIQYYWPESDPTAVEEFWTEVFRAYWRARRKLRAPPANSSNLQWRKGQRMLSRHGWADLSYFRKKHNVLYETISGNIQYTISAMRDHEDLEFFNCMWMMENDVREIFTHVAPSPHLALKIFVLLPSPAKAERYLFNYGRGGLYYVAIHFPTVFPERGRWSNISRPACRLLKQYFRHEIVNNVDEIRRVAFASPESISDAEIDQALRCLERERWDRLTKIYLLVFRQSRGWGDYLNYLREKGAWID